MMMKVKNMMILGMVLMASMNTWARGEEPKGNDSKKTFVLEVYGGEVPNVKPTFEEEHYLGDEITKKWNTFL